MRLCVPKMSASMHAMGALLALLAIWAPALLWLRTAWFANPDYGGLYVVPLFAVVSFFHRKEQWDHLPIQPVCWAWTVLGMLAAASLCFSSATPRASLLCLSPAIAMLVLALYGWKHLRLILPVLVYGLLVVPPPQALWSELTLLMRFFSLESSRFVVNLLPIGPVRVEEFSIILGGAGQRLVVADACSGVRSLLSLTVVGLWLIMDARCRAAPKVALALCIPLIAHVLNTFRIVITVWLFSADLNHYAEGHWHTLTGYATLAAGLGIILGTVRQLERCAPQRSIVRTHKVHA